MVCDPLLQADRGGPTPISHAACCGTLKSGATTVQAPNGQTIMAGVWGAMWGMYPTDPATGAAWTPIAVNNLQIGPVLVA